MSYKIQYAYTCSRGKVRKNNEDNFWVLGNYLERLNGGMATIVEGQVMGKTPVSVGSEQEIGIRGGCQFPV